MIQTEVNTFFIDDQSVNIADCSEQTKFEFKFSPPCQLGRDPNEKDTAYVNAGNKVDEICGPAIIFLDLKFEGVPQTHYSVVALKGEGSCAEDAGFALLERILNNQRFSGIVWVSTSSVTDALRTFVTEKTRPIIEGRRIKILVGGSMSGGRFQNIPKSWSQGIDEFLKLFNDHWFYLNPPRKENESKAQIRWFGAGYHNYTKEDAAGYQLHLNSIRSRYTNARFLCDDELKRTFDSGSDSIVRARNRDHLIDWRALFLLFEETEIKFCNNGQLARSESESGLCVSYHGLSLIPTNHDTSIMIGEQICVPIAPGFPFLLCLKQLHEKLKGTVLPAYLVHSENGKLFIGFKNKRLEQVSTFDDMKNAVKEGLDLLRQDPASFEKYESQKQVTKAITRLIACSPFVDSDLRNTYLYPLVDSANVNDFGVEFAKRSFANSEYFGVEWSGAG